MANVFTKSKELGKLTEKEIADQDAKLKANEGKRELVADLLPPTWNDAAMDKAKAEKDGWIEKQDDHLDEEIKVK